MRTNTSQYEFSHGHKPRGWGWWMMEVHFYLAGGGGRLCAETMSAEGTMAEARAAIVRNLKRKTDCPVTVTEVVVLP